MTVRRYRQDPLEFHRCPVALLAENPKIAALSTWGHGAMYHEEKGDLIPVHCDGSPLSAQGHQVLDVFISAQSQRQREEDAEAKRKAEAAKHARK